MQQLNRLDMLAHNTQQCTQVVAAAADADAPAGVCC
jgi:hypothetical protein